MDDAISRLSGVGGDYTSLENILRCSQSVHRTDCDAGEFYRRQVNCKLDSFNRDVVPPLTRQSSVGQVLPGNLECR